MGSYTDKKRELFKKISACCIIKHQVARFIWKIFKSKLKILHENVTSMIQNNINIILKSLNSLIQL